MASSIVYVILNYKREIFEITEREFSEITDQMVGKIDTIDLKLT